MAQLSVNSVLALAIFTHLYEAFMGVMPSVCVFQQLFRVTLRGGSNDPVGSILFAIHDRNLYIEYGLSGKVDDSKKQWMCLSSDAIHNNLYFPRRILELVIDY